MQTPNSNSPAALCREVLADANRRRDEILRRAQSDAAQILAEAQARIERTRQENLIHAQADARRRADAILAGVAAESKRRRSEQLEECLRIIYKRIAEALRGLDAAGFRHAVIHAVANALPHLRGGAFALRISPDKAGFLGNGLAEEIRLHSKKSFSSLEITADPKLKDGKMILQDLPGRQAWNLGLEAQLERSWPELRRQIAAQLLSAVQSPNQD